MSDSQQNAIELCDGILRSEGLPAYSDLRAALSATASQEKGS